MPTASSPPGADHPVGPVSGDVAAIIVAFTDRIYPFLLRQITGDPAGEMLRTRRLTQADLDSEPVRLARCRGWVAGGYLRSVVAHQLYPGRFAHPGPFDTPERLARVEDLYQRRYGPRPSTFAARMADGSTRR